MTNPTPEPATATNELTTTGHAPILVPELTHAALAFAYCMAAARGATPAGGVAVFVDEAGRVLDTATPGDGTTSSATTPDPHRLDTMTVTVRNRGAETPWGSGPTNPKTTVVTISAYCTTPGCGRRRGEPTGQNTCDDGAWYWVERWLNPCGHVDYYEQVIREAHDRLVARTGGRWEQVTPPDELDGYGWFGDVHMVGLIAATRGGRHPEFAAVVAQSDTEVRFRSREGGALLVFGWRPHKPATATDTDTPVDVGRATGGATPDATDRATPSPVDATGAATPSATEVAPRATPHVTTAATGSATDPATGSGSAPLIPLPMQADLVRHEPRRFDDSGTYVDWTIVYGINGQLDGREIYDSDLNVLIDNMVGDAHKWITEAEPPLTSRDGHHTDDLTIAWTVGGNPGDHATVTDAIAAAGVTLPDTVLSWPGHPDLPGR